MIVTTLYVSDMSLYSMRSVRELVVKRITLIEFGVNDGDGSVTGCCRVIKLRVDTAKLTNIIA